MTDCLSLTHYTIPHIGISYRISPHLSALFNTLFDTCVLQSRGDVCITQRPFISLLSFKKREQRISDSCSPLNWLLVSGCSFHLNSGWHYLPIFSFFNRMLPYTSSKGGWRWLPHPTGSHSLFLPWPPPHTVIYRSHASAFWNSRLTMNSGAIQLLPREHLVRLFPVAHFSVASFSFQWLNRSSNTSHGKYNSEVSENTVQQCFLMSFVHIFLDLIVSSFPFHPRRVTNSFPFSLLPPCKYLETLLISRLSHPLAQSCLWFLLPLLINRTSCTLIARNMPSPGKRRWEQQSQMGYVRKSRGRFREWSWWNFSSVVPHLLRPLPRCLLFNFYLSFYTIFLKRAFQIILF